MFLKAMSTEFSHAIAVSLKHNTRDYMSQQIDSVPMVRVAEPNKDAGDVSFIL